MSSDQDWMPFWKRCFSQTEVIELNMGTGVKFKACAIQEVRLAHLTSLLALNSLNLWTCLRSLLFKSTLIGLQELKWLKLSFPLDQWLSTFPDDRTLFRRLIGLAYPPNFPSLKNYSLTKSNIKTQVSQHHITEKLLTFSFWSYNYKMNWLEYKYCTYTSECFSLLSLVWHLSPTRQGWRPSPRWWDWCM